MKLIFKTFLGLFLLPKLIFTQNLINDGDNFQTTITSPCAEILSNWNPVLKPNNFGCAQFDGNCNKIQIFSTLNNLGLCGNACGEFSALTISGTRGIPSTASWFAQNTPNSLNSSFESYLGLPLTEASNCARSGIIQQLPNKLKKGFYRVEFDAVFKTNLPINETALIRIQMDDNESLADPEISISIPISETGGSSNNTWQHIVAFFEVEDCDEIDFFKLLRLDGEIGGLILVDNIELHDICAEENRCNLNKYNDDNSNITSNEVHTSQTPLNFSGLAGIPMATLAIYNNGNIVSTMAFIKPLNTIYWDGKDEEGNELPNTVYTYRLFLFTLCDCGFEKNGSFLKSGNLNIPTPILTNNIQSNTQVITFGNLSNVHEFSFKVRSILGAELYSSPIFINPSNTFNWNGIVGGNSSLNPAQYQVAMKYKNNRNTVEKSIPILVIDDIDYSAFPTNYFENNSVIKPSSFQCFYDNYFPAYYAPLPCCSTSLDLNYSNGYIDGNQTFEAAGNIYLGDGLTVLPNSNINFYANETIEVNPGVVIDGTSSVVTLENLNCAPQRVGIINNPILTTSENLSQSILNKKTFSGNSTISVFPNPASKSITISSTDELKNILVFNLFGEQIYNINKLGKNNVEIATDQLSNGVYIFSIQTENTSKRERVIIQK
ncbi:MAG: T9SS type A sorting domain-containing protein [Bacteroidia bacterium]